MRRNAMISFLLLSLCLWMMFSYFAWKRSKKQEFYNELWQQKLDLDERIKRLEDDINQQKQLENTFIQNLRKIFNQPESSKEIAEISPDAAPTNEIVLPVLMFSCNRPSVKRSLDLLLKYRPSKTKFPIIVSQDCGHPETAEVLDSYGDEIVNIKQPDLEEMIVPDSDKKFKGYYKISRHYGFGLREVFNVMKHKAVVIVEDDLDVSADFFEYFAATYPILKNDPTLWCVSAWNDNGKPGLIEDSASDVLYRSDFFPGLGWMMTEDMWKELDPKWPKSFWDDWMRLPEQRKDRACIRPEISRTRTFGKVGVSNGLFFDNHLKYIKLNEQTVAFTDQDLSHLLKENYDREFQKRVDDAPVVAPDDLRTNKYSGSGSVVRLLYRSKSTFTKLAKLFGLMTDFKSGVPRTAYKGIVTFYYNGVRVFLAPSYNWKGYDPTW